MPHTHARAALWLPCESSNQKACCTPSQPPWQLVAGEQIDHLFGAKLGLSVLASAGLGNMVADVVGVSATHTIQVRARLLWRAAACGSHAWALQIKRHPMRNPGGQSWEIRAEGGAGGRCLAHTGAWQAQGC